MLTVANVLATIDEIAPLSKAAGWDPVGIQLGDPTAPANTVAVCHEVTSEVASAAIEANVDLLVAYHPLLFHATNRVVAGSSASGRAFSLIRHGVALAVVHTAFDVAAGGTADALASALGIGDTAGFAPAWARDAVKFVVFVPAQDADAVAGAMAAAGAGVIGNYTGCSFRSDGKGFFSPGPGATPAVGTSDTPSVADEVRVEMVAPAARRDAVAAAIVGSHPYEEPAFDVYDQRGNAGMIGRVGRLAEPVSFGEFAATTADALGGVHRTAGDPKRPVGTVAVVPGSGTDFIAEAAAVADVLVTGDVSHHRAQDALHRGLAVIDAGHVATERPGIAALYAAVSRAVGGAVDLTGIDTDPWKEGW